MEEEERILLGTVLPVPPPVSTPTEQTGGLSRCGRPGWAEPQVGSTRHAVAMWTWQAHGHGSYESVIVAVGRLSSAAQQGRGLASCKDLAQVSEGGGPVAGHPGKG